MSRADNRIASRQDALSRARQHSPFLREALAARGDIEEIFLAEGASRAAKHALDAAPDAPIERQLRQRRLGLALAVALGDLARELPLEEVTALLSDFADGAIDQAVAAAIAERVPDAEPVGFTVIAMGKLGSHELNYSSDVDLLLLFDPATLPRRERDDAGEAAVRIGRRLIELLQKRTEDGYVQRVDLRLRPSPEVTPIGTADYPTPAARPAYSVLDSRHFRARFGAGLPDWQTQLRLAVEDLR